LFRRNYAKLILPLLVGIGETLAVRCYSAWEAASTAYSPSPDLKTIKKLSNEELISFMDANKRRKNVAVPSGCQGKKPTSQSGELNSREVLVVSCVYTEIILNMDAKLCNSSRYLIGEP
ncbi:hypothetical protein ANCCAN_28293, partial [Ancylostoma caninum]